MRAFQMHGVGEAGVDHVEEPTLGPGDLLLEPVISGICATDVHVLYEGALVGELPLTLGHEVIGRVAAVGGGDAADRFHEGDLVSVEPLLPCWSCRPCLRGRPNLCARSTHLGISADGCFADFVSVPAARASLVPEALNPEQAIFIEPFACALHFVHRARVAPGDLVVILGGGPAGLLTLQAAKLAGATVVVSEPLPTRRSLATTLGADVVVHPDDLSAAIEATSAGVADVIIEVTGVPAAVEQAVSVAGPGTTVVITGVCGGARPALDTNLVVTRELDLLGAVASRWQFDRAATLLAAGAVTTAPMASRTGGFDEIGGFLALARGDRDLCKLLIDHRR